MTPARLQSVEFAVAATIAAAPGIAAGTFGGSLAITSDYVYQGLSETCGHPAVQADLYVRTSAASAWQTFFGLWGSEGLGATRCGASREINIYAGQTFALGQSSNVSISYVHYAFPGGSYLYGAGYRYDYDELQAAWSYQDRIYVTVGWTPDAVAYHDYVAHQDRSAFNYGAELHQPIVGALSLSVGAGYDQVFDPTGAGYAFWNAGLAYTVGRVEITASYFRTATRAERLFSPYVAGGRGAAAVVWRF